MNLLLSPKQTINNPRSSQFFSQYTSVPPKSSNLQFNNQKSTSHITLKGLQVSKRLHNNKQQTLSIKLSKHQIQKLQKKHLHETYSKNDIKLGRQETQIFRLNPELQNFRIRNRLNDEKQQIKHVNTLKKIKKAGKKLSCDVLAKSSGIQLQMRSQGQIKSKQLNYYSYSKGINRDLRTKVLQRIKACNIQSKSMISVRYNNEINLKNTIKLSKQTQKYDNYPLKRMENSLMITANQKKKIPFFVKKHLDQKISQIDKIHKQEQTYLQKSRRQRQEDSDGYNFSSPESSPRQRKSHDQATPALRGSNNRNNTKLNQLLSQYEEDIFEFSQICEFFKKIQHELLKYLPNNHLSNKIQTIFSQVEKGALIRKIYNKCNTDIQSITPKKIIAYLKREQGLLSIMNYIVNVIKLNISAERRKRFKNVEKVISKFQSLIQERAIAICGNFKNIEDRTIKNDIKTTLESTDISCLGLNSDYINFVKEAEKQQFSEKGVHRRRKFICQLLKFQSLMD